MLESTDNPDTQKPFKPLRPQRAKGFLSDFEQPLFMLSKNDSFRINNAYEGVQIFGGTGSGKTSGSGRSLAHSFLKCGFGGLVLCAKPSERAQWEQYAYECNRQDSVIIIDGKNNHCFNFIEYELARIDEGATVDNVVSVFMNIMEAGKRGKQSQAQENPFWKDASREYLSNAIELLYMAYGRVRLLELFELSQSLPKSAEEMNDPDFQKESFFFETIRKLQINPANPVDTQDLRVISNYFSRIFARLDPKTKSNLIITLSSMLSPFMKGKMRELFANNTSIVPEMSHEGAIIIIDLPLKIWEQTGIIGQHIFKYAWQRATERRAINNKTRPVFLWADESQFFVSSYDKEFQSTARSSKACSVYLTQSINGYFTALGDENAAYEFLTNFQTKIFHANTDPKTNQYASEIIGKYSQYRRNRSNSSGSTHGYGTSYSKNEGRSQSFGTSSSLNNSGTSISSNFGRTDGSSRTDSNNSSWNSSQSQGASEVMDYLLQPSFFAAGLKKGGRRNKMKVGGVIMTGGENYSNKLPFMVVEFSQT